MSEAPIDVYNNELMKIRVIMKDPNTEGFEENDENLKPYLIGYGGTNSWELEKLTDKIAEVFYAWGVREQTQAEKEEWAQAIEDTAQIEKNIKNRRLKMVVWFDPDSVDGHEVDVTVVKFNYGTKISDQDSEALMQL